MIWQNEDLERVMEELLLGSIFYCCQFRGKSRTAGSDQMAPIYTRQTWTRNIVGILPGNIMGFTHNILEASLRKQWSKVENMRTTFALDDVAYSFTPGAKKIWWNNFDVASNDIYRISMSFQNWRQIIQVLHESTTDTILDNSFFFLWFSGFKNFFVNYDFCVKKTKFALGTDGLLRLVIYVISCDFFGGRIPWLFFILFLVEHFFIKRKLGQ